MQRKILMTGTHGVGKSTAALTMAAQIKTENRKLSVKVIEETVRELLSGTNALEMNTPQFQRLAFVEYLQREWLAEAKYDVVICDRTALDVLVYGLCYGLKLAPELFSFALRHLDSFTEIYFYRPNGEEITDDGFRDVDKANQLMIDLELERMLKLWGGKYTEVKI